MSNAEVVWSEDSRTRALEATLARVWGEQSKLRRVLAELLEQIDMLEGYELRRDPVDQYKVDAAWNDAIEQARDAL
jgi:hypothetical protein